MGSDDEQQRAEAVARHLGRLRDLPRVWLDVVGRVGRLRGSRHLEQLTVHAIELLETTNVAADRHPGTRPLAPFLDGCHDLRGVWQLDTVAGELRLRAAELLLQPLPLPGDGAEDDHLIVGVHFIDPGPAPEARVEVLTSSVVRADALGVQWRTDAALPVLAVAVRDRLIDGLVAAAVLSRAPEGDGEAPFAPPGEDGPEVTPSIARQADLVVELLTELEHELARRAAAARAPVGPEEEDAGLEDRRRRILAGCERVLVDVHQRLPVGTLEPVRLNARISIGHDEDEGTSELLPWGYVLRLDLVAGRRGSGVIEVAAGAGIVLRPVDLPHVTELWTDHVDAALRRAHVVVPAVRRPPREELERPIPEVRPPVAHPPWVPVQRPMVAHPDDVPF